MPKSNQPQRAPHIGAGSNLAHSFIAVQPNNMSLSEFFEVLSKTFCRFFGVIYDIHLSGWRDCAADLCIHTHKFFSLFRIDGAPSILNTYTIYTDVMIVGGFQVSSSTHGNKR
jgi:hypothetical protein